MSFFQTRTDYFKSLANTNKLIAHDRFVSGTSGPKRISFFRLNDEEELNAAAANFMHLPCMVHFGYGGKYTENKDEVRKRVLLNDLLFLDKVTGPANMASIQAARDRAFGVMEDTIA